MPGRFNLWTDPAALADTFQLDRPPEWSPRYNIAPNQQILVIRQQADGKRTGDLLRWGLVPPWADDTTLGAKMINARSETVATKPAFREAFRHRRCLIPVTGFYEWQPVAGRGKQPWHIHHKAHELLTFAGLWETWTDENGAGLETCTIVTTEPNHFIADLHDRMPVILPPAARDIWLDCTQSDPLVLQALLVPFAEESLVREPIGTLINSPRNDSEACIKPAKMSRGLFD